MFPIIRKHNRRVLCDPALPFTHSVLTPEPEERRQMRIAAENMIHVQHWRRELRLFKAWEAMPWRMV